MHPCTTAIPLQHDSKNRCQKVECCSNMVVDWGGNDHRTGAFGRDNKVDRVWIVNHGVEADLGCHPSIG